MKRALLLVAAAACGPKSTTAPIATLPGDGMEHTAKPIAPKAAPVVDPWTGRADLYTPPAPQPPAAVAVPPIESYQLANGLQVFVIKSDRLPVVSMQLAVRAGRVQEPRARLGVSEFVADMLPKGTKKHTALELAKTIDFVGGTIAADATFEATLVSCSVLAKSQATCMQLLPEIVTEPAFPEDELSKVRERQLATVRQRLDDAGALAAAHVQNLLWGNDHVRGWIANEQSVASITRDDLIAWHKTWFVPGNAMLVVSGDVDTKKLKGDLERAFGGWKKAPVAPVPSYHEPGLSGSRIRLVDKPGATQTHIRIAQFGIKHDDARFFDSLVWNYALGGGEFSSRLMQVVRVQGGKTYGASSAFDRNLDKGSFVATTFTRNAEAVATAKLMLGEIAKMQKDGPTREEVAGAIANIAGGYGLRFQSAADVGAALIGAELHGFGKEYLTNFPIAVGEVTRESAAKAAHEILDPSAYVMVMVGDAKDLEPLLKKAGWRYEKVAFTDPITAPVPEAALPTDPKAIAAARATIAEAIAAKGGLAKLTAMKALRMIAAGTTTIQGKSVTVDIDRTFVVPDKLRFDATLAGQVKVSIGIDGEKGWQSAPDQQTGKQTTVALEGADMASINFERWREPDLILLKANDPKATLAEMPTEQLGEKAQSVVRLKSPYSGIDVTIYIDKRTKLVTQMTYSEGGTEETDVFADYRTVNGIKISYHRTQTASGRITDYTLKTVEIDPKIDPAMFAQPAK
ncbi:MAG TPA: pitrilysin family protein [Kofleriaceae bacterium]